MHARNPAAIQYQGPQFSWKEDILYHYDGEKTELVVSQGLKPGLCFLVHWPG